MRRILMREEPAEVNRVARASGTARRFDPVVRVPSRPPRWHVPDSALLHERRALAASQQDPPYYDPIEDDHTIGGIIRYVEHVVVESPFFRDRRRRAESLNGSLFWHMKQGILRIRYGIVWFTPAQMSPWMCYD